MLKNQNGTKKYYSVINNHQQFKKEKVSSFAEIWECKQTGAKSLHSRIEILPGDVIAQIGIEGYVEKPNYLSVQIDDTKHILLVPNFLQYINHSCDPNVFFDTMNMVVTCLRKIDMDEAITFFYPSTEWSMEQGFDCLCGSEKCLEKIQGASYLSKDILKKYRLAEHISKKL
ncbi:SET domain-containing protein-lysine N-methyltransferase [Microcoleus sp. ARI1-B5]|uniref:SET domain-containing protein-lysine N-methyltransferase n=1 Tax=unclassified Microcoleus TaxID=2642155 RepID=UPI002FD1EE1C